MLGYKTWEVDLDEKNMPRLTSITAEYIWETNTVGEKLDYLAKIDETKLIYFDEVDQKWRDYVSVVYGEDDVHIPELGFFSYKRLSDAIYEAFSFPGIIVAGSVNNFGKIHEHERGYRSEFCQVTGLLPKLRCSASGHGVDEDGATELYFYENGLTLALCPVHAKERLEFGKPSVQYEKNLFMKHLCQRYEVYSKDVK